MTWAIIALKVISQKGGEAELARFRTEGEVIARLQHPGIVQVFEVGEHEGQPFMALEFCAGGVRRASVGDPVGARPTR